jgi:hypothetical protein
MKDANGQLLFYPDAVRAGSSVLALFEVLFFHIGY